MYAAVWGPRSDTTYASAGDVDVCEVCENCGWAGQCTSAPGWKRRVENGGGVYGAESGVSAQVQGVGGKDGPDV